MFLQERSTPSKKKGKRGGTHSCANAIGNAVITKTFKGRERGRRAVPKKGARNSRNEYRERAGRSRGA